MKNKKHRARGALGTFANVEGWGHIVNLTLGQRVMVRLVTLYLVAFYRVA